MSAVAVAPQLCLAVCENRRREVEAALVLGGHAGVSVTAFPAACGQPMLDWPTLEAAVLAAGAGDRDLRVLGGGCLLRLGAPPPGPLERGVVEKSENCFSMVAGKSHVEHLLREGRFLLSPGWLERWREHLSAGGFDRETAQEIFGETTTGLTLLDTGVLPEAPALLEACGRFVQRPCTVVPVGLDHLALFVGRIVDAWSTQVQRAAAGESLAQANRRSADYLMVFDIVGTLAGITGETAAVGNVLDLFSMLFAPASLVFVPFDDDLPGSIRAQPSTASCDLEQVRRFCAPGGAATWTLGTAGFMVRIAHREQTLGVIVVAGVAFPEHRDHYRSVAETIARVCGLAIANARAYGRLEETIGELTAAREGAKTLAGLIPICASCKKIRDDVGYWHSVEQYVQEHSEVTFTHGICPDCKKVFFPGIG